MAEHNPFEDPDVQAASKPQYGGDAYGDSGGGEYNAQAQPPPAPASGGGLPPAANQAAVTAGTQVASAAASQAVGEAKTEYKQAQADQADHVAPPPPPNWCIRLWQWIPIRMLAWIGGLMMIAFPMIDIFLNLDDSSFIGFFVYFYIIFFGVCITAVETPTWRCTRKIQLGVYFWTRFMSRIWGRGWFYLFSSLLCMSELDQTFNISAIAGIWMVIVALLMFIVSRTSAKKYQRMFIYTAAGTEGEEMLARFDAKFSELDMDQDGFVTQEGIVKLAAQAGRDLSNSERHTIATFLDETCNGKVSREDWNRMWNKYNLKQRFL